MHTTKQANALRLADELNDKLHDWTCAHHAAAELRRLHAENEILRAAPSTSQAKQVIEKFEKLAAPSASPDTVTMKPMDGGWFLIHPEFLCDIQNQGGVWSVFFRDVATGSEAFKERAAPSASQPKKLQDEVTYYGIIDPDYARVFTQARIVAWQYGYACVMHGSFTRDLDLLLVPWTEKARDNHDQLLKLIAQAAFLRFSDGQQDIIKSKVDWTEKPNGRKSCSLFFRGFGDRRWIDISVVPHAPSTSPVYIRRDQYQKAQIAPYMCEVGPNPREDRIPLYATPQAAPSTSNEIETLKAEVERLRAALTTIGNWGGTTRFYGSGSYTDVARVALGEGAQS